MPVGAINAEPTAWQLTPPKWQSRIRFRFTKFHEAFYVHQVRTQAQKAICRYADERRRKQRHGGNFFSEEGVQAVGHKRRRKYKKSNHNEIFKKAEREVYVPF